MKLTFEGPTIHVIINEMRIMLASIAKETPQAAVNKPDPEVLRRATAQGPKPQAGYPGPDVQREVKEVLQKIEQRVVADIVDNAVRIPVDKSGKKPRTEKQLANDEKMRIAALERVAAKRAAKVTASAALEAPLPPPLATAEGMDPAEVVRIRQKTIVDLQEAYANGHQQEVFELLSRFGNGAKSFRELPPEAFMPIRQAIDNGALT